MGPIALFDKSFLQSLSVDESVWFDHFFLPVICPLFYVETLADLEKAVRQGRSPEQEVGIIAQKVPEMSGSIVAHHSHLALGSLLGYELPMDGRIPRPGGRRVEVEGKKGIVYTPSEEEQAFDRWQKGEFLEVERRFARVWRTALNSLDLMAVAAGIRALGIQPEACKSLEVARGVADSFTTQSDLAQDRVKLAMIILGVPKEDEPAIVERMANAGWPSLALAAPFAAHVIGVEIFFQICVAANLIGAQRISNRTDIAYLYYLPFCHVFVSSDHLHRRCAPHFLRKDQSFVWGLDLKEELHRLNEHYAALPEDEKKRGLFKIARRPPLTGNGLVTRLWDRHLAPSWRELAEVGPVRDPETDQKIIDEINRFADAPAASVEDIGLNLEDTDAICIQRRVRKRKGSWWQLPHDLKENGE